MKKRLTLPFRDYLSHNEVEGASVVNGEYLETPVTTTVNELRREKKSDLEAAKAKLIADHDAEVAKITVKTDKFPK